MDPTDLTIPIDWETAPSLLYERAQSAFGSLAFLTLNGTSHNEMVRMNVERAKIVFSPQVTMLKSGVDPYVEDVGFTNRQLKNYIKLKLIELTMSPKDTTQLRALELLGKSADIGMFVDTVNVNVSSKSKEELENDLVNSLGKFLKLPLVGESRAGSYDPLSEQKAEGFTRESEVDDMEDIAINDA